MSDKNRKRKSLWCIVRIATMTLLLLLLMLLAFGYFIGSRQFIVNQETLYFEDLPEEFDGYRILQFSDMHIGTFKMGHSADIDTIVNLINRQRCDAILFTGDLIGRRSNELDGYRHTLSKLKAPDGVYSIMGNHDYGTYYKFASNSDRLADVGELQRKERSYGWNLLLNEHVKIKRGNAAIAIIGVENDGMPPFPAYANLPKAAKGLKKTDFCILMTHDPTHWRRKVLPTTSFQLTLSGHTHGGQFKIFGWSPCSLRYPEWSGVYKEGSQILNVSDGVGCSSIFLPFRFGAWPEVNVITLKRL